jgi:hypoxanthine phosphoribosyltransferase
VRELLSEQTIRDRVCEMAAEISKDYSDRTPIFVGILNGSFVFMADLLRELTEDSEVDFLKVSSYEGTETSGTVHLLKDISAEITGRDIVIVEDIIDSGLTINFIVHRLKESGPSSVAVATLLFKKEVAQLNFDPDYIGFIIPSDFVVGYGLDHNQKMRNLKNICVLDQEDLTA